MNSSLSLVVETDQGDIEIPWQTGQSLRDLMLDADIPVSPGCGSTGQCGRCRIQVIQGEVSQPGRLEKETLSAIEIWSGVRLACQLLPMGGIRLKQIVPGLSRTWSLIEIDKKTDFVQMPLTNLSAQNRYALAVDLGTTRIRISLWDLKRGKRLAACTGNNPQASYGFDVLTRITRAVESESQAGKLSRLAKNAIKSGMDFLLDHHQISMKNVGRVMISGNTAMLTLLLGKGYDRLLNPDNWMQKIACQPENMEMWLREWKLPGETHFVLLDPLSGFVGSDLTAAVLATGLKKGPSCALLIDFGTNSEIALWDTKHLWVTAAAGGPAFELGSSECGMTAVEGAVYRFEQENTNQTPRYKVIGDGIPQGICGSAMVDIISCLISQGRLKPNGNFSQDQPGNRLQVLEGIWLHKKDVDAFQRAKAAVAAGVACLLNRAGKNVNEVKRLCVCGAFGQFLHLHHAKSVGLLPPVPSPGIELWGEAVLLGTERMLATPDIYADEFSNDITVINMSSDQAFEKHFVKCLFLKPINSEDGYA